MAIQVDQLLPLASAQVTDANIDNIRAAGAIAVKRAYATSPVRTGRLRSSIKAAAIKDGMSLYSDVKYAQYHPEPFVEGLDAAVEYLRRLGYR